MLNKITILPGEKRELVLMNEPNVDYHIIQEANSQLRVHIVYVS